ncbi:MAG: ATP-binding protein [Pseudomonadota bacterium]
MISTWLLLTWLLLTSGVTLAQDPLMHSVTGDVLVRWTVENGLPINAVTDLAQDEAGFLWLSTRAGLVRFDGLSFKTYDSHAYPGLASDRLTNLYQMANQDLWVRSEQSDLARFDGTGFRSLTTWPGFEQAQVISGDQNQQGRLALGLRDGLALVDANGPQRILADEVRGIGEHVLWSSPERIWAVVDQVLLDISLAHEPSATGAKSNAQIGRRWPLPAGTPRLLQTDNTLWIGTAAGLYRLDLPLTANSRPVAQPGLPGRGISRLAQHPEGGLLVDTGDTVWWQRLDSEAKSIQPPKHGWHTEPLFEGLALRQHTEFLVPFEHTTGIHLDAGLVQQNDRHQQFDAAIIAALLDRAGNTWLALHGKGLALHRSSSLRSLGVPEGLPGENVYPIFQASDGAIWIGILGLGAVRIDPDVDAPTPFTVYQNDSLWVWSIAEFDDGIWLGGEPCKVVGSVCIDKPLIPTDDDSDGFTPGSVYLLYRDQNGNGWLGTEFGGLYQKHGEQWIQSSLMQHDWPIKTPIRTVEQAPDGALWFGTGGDGIVRIAGTAVEQYTVRDGLNSNLIRDLWFDRDGHLLVATENRGLCRLERLQHDPSARVDIAEVDIRCISTAEGLFSNSLHQILPGGNDKLWISTNRGIFWLNQSELAQVFNGDQPRIGQTGVIDASNGMRNSELNGGAFPTGLRDRNGRLWWPGQSGLIVMEPDSDEAAIQFPAVHGIVDEVITGSARYPIQQAALQLPSGDRSVQLVLTAAAFNDPANVQFRFNIPTIDSGWVEAGRSRLVGPINLPPGELEIVTQARAGAGPWGESSTLQLVVPRYWYEHLLVRLLLVALLIGVVAWLVRAMEQSRARHRVRLEQTIDERTAALQQAKQQTEQALESVRRSAKLRTDLFANIGHELRTPLTLISGPLEDAVQARRSISVATLDGMSHSTRRMQHLVDQILDLRQTDDATFSLNRVSENVLSLLTHCCVPLTALAARRGLNLVLSSQLVEARADLDRDAFEKIIGNLLSNAIKFSAPGSKIIVDLSDHSNQSLMITVKDQGPGVPEEDAEHIFERFYRTRRSRQQAIEGTGIGLSLARQLARLHGGDIELQNPGATGAIFVLQLPATRVVCGDRPMVIELPQPKPTPGIAETDCTTGFSSKQPTAPEVQQASRPSFEIGGLGLSHVRPRVLVVEDDFNLREYMIHCLNDRYEMLEAGNGHDGLQLARTAKPDLIVTDVMMPEMDGFMLVRELREDANTAAIPVLMLTALGPSGEVEGLISGADDYLSKPFNREQLRARIHARLGDRERILRALKQWRAFESEKHAINGLDDPSDANIGRAHPIVERVRKQIMQHLHDVDYSVVKLAQDLHLSRSQLHRALTEHTGSSPGKLMRELRLEAAGELLKQGFSILDVAITTGFTSSSVFSRSFKNYFGCPPSQWK